MFERRRQRGAPLLLAPDPERKPDRRPLDVCPEWGLGSARSWPGHRVARHHGTQMNPEHTGVIVMKLIYSSKHSRREEKQFGSQPTLREEGIIG